MADSDYCGPAPPEIKGEAVAGFSIYVPGKVEKITFSLEHKSKDLKH